ncbi:MAG: hypothetical protein R2731_10055 [Nocardioides sp.]
MESRQLPRVVLGLPREYPDFAWAWVTRFLVNLGNFIALTYFLYHLTDGLGFTDDEGTSRPFTLTAIYGATIVSPPSPSAPGATGSASARSS